MKLIATKVSLANGGKLVNGYRVMLTKSEVEKAGFKEGDELVATYSQDKIILEKNKAQHN